MFFFIFETIKTFNIFSMKLQGQIETQTQKIKNTVPNMVYIVPLGVMTEHRSRSKH